MINHQSSKSPTQDRSSHPAPRIAGRLQSFACYAEDATTHEDRLPLVRIHDLSLQAVVTQNVPDLRAGAIVRLLIPAVGWRHIEVQWIRRGIACFHFLLPLLPHELHAALESDPTDRTDRPRSRRRTTAPRSIDARAMPRRSQRRAVRLPIRPDIRAAGRELIAMLAQSAGSIFAAPLRTV